MRFVLYVLYPLVTLYFVRVVFVVEYGKIENIK